MRRLFVRPAARIDLLDIGDFIAAENPKRALSFVDEIEAVFLKIASRPESFAIRHELADGLRAARHGVYLILFEADAEEVRITRVLHGARDLKRLL